MITKNHSDLPCSFNDQIKYGIENTESKVSTLYRRKDTVWKITVDIRLVLKYFSFMLLYKYKMKNQTKDAIQFN